MKSDFEILGIIPARGGSKTVPNKNVKLLAEKPLLAYTVKEALKSQYIDRLVVTTDDAAIAEIARSLGAEVPFMRPQELGEDHVPDLPVFRHCLQWLKEHEDYLPDIIVHLRPTAPLRKIQHIDKGIEMLLDAPGADSVRSVTPAGQHPLKMWRIENNQLEPFVPFEFHKIKECYNIARQKLPTAYVQNGSVDIIWRKTIVQKQSMTGDVILPMIMDEEESVNIDSNVDFILADILMKRKSARSNDEKS